DIAQDQALASIVDSSSAIELQVVIVLRCGIALSATKPLITLIVIDGMSKGISAQEREAIGESLVDLHLKGIVFRAGVRGGEEHDDKVGVRPPWLQVADTWVRLIGKQMQITQSETSSAN